MSGTWQEASDKCGGWGKRCTSPTKKRNNGWEHCSPSPFELEQIELEKEFWNKKHEKCVKVFKHGNGEGWGWNSFLFWECRCNSKHVFQVHESGHVRYYKR